jgi:hypothetical protein
VPTKEEILQQWKEANPQLVKELQASGDLDRLVTSAFELASNAYADCVAGGLAADQARELTREMWMQPPSRRQE